MSLVIIITYINIYNFFIYKSNKEIIANTSNLSSQLEKEELLKKERNKIEKELYGKICCDNILIEELSKKEDGNIKCSIVVLGDKEKQYLLLEELAEISFLEIENIEVSYDINNQAELRAKFELKYDIG